MSTESYYLKAEREAANKLQALLLLPLPALDGECGSEGTFDPWQLFPALYGTYDSDFDRLAIEVLEETLAGKKHRDDLAAEMFREMLCTSEFCSYGTSPRVCFANPKFKELLPSLIEKWRAYSAVQWGGDIFEEPKP